MKLISLVLLILNSAEYGLYFSKNEDVLYNSKTLKEGGFLEYSNNIVEKLNQMVLNANQGDLENKGGNGNVVNERANNNLEESIINSIIGFIGHLG
ncbi:hypothetical protein DICPUDRAFT_159967 [Dictyostelium purpureum]|uniref:Uncharacterized protein n=1 Tax=Dictyostelium purpureum TaxID=5786 RepID=F1A5E2_DICPU|nr:uncharacterized protein DICPUDRAFT_159967 [Dictyostelium purpureum]EGC28587.1 hypothetical protein DICPUDRAFT_159967 [Dictyostelium purpureum]|eukprot:XP_003294886.1 hypothetical protein DICPUDRAFT_159967 [Dictyostelium purpureum]